MKQFIHIHWNRMMAGYRRWRKEVFILFALYLVTFYNILRCNDYFLDDLGRAFSGYHGWLDWSRWFTEFFSSIVHADWYLADISPLPQIIACFLTALASITLYIIVVKNSTENTGEEASEIEKMMQNISGVAASALVGLCPYFLGMISYKYDSPYMAFSVFISMFPILFIRNNQKYYCLTVFLCTLLMCTSYQSASGIFPCVGLFVVAWWINSGRRVSGGLLRSALSYSAALLFYRFVLMRPNGSSTALAPAGGMVGVAIEKYLRFIEYIVTDLKKLWLVLILLLIVLYLICFVINSSINKGIALLIGITHLIVCSILSFGVNLILEVDKYDCRAMEGVSVFLAIICIYISINFKSVIPRIVCAVLIWCFATFSFEYGNMLIQQGQYRDFIAQMIVWDLSEADIMKSDEQKTLHIEGNLSLAPEIINAADGYNILPRLIHSGLGEGTWGEYYLVHYLGLQNVQGTPDRYVVSDYKNTYEMFKRNNFYTIYLHDNDIVIELYS